MSASVVKRLLIIIPVVVVVTLASLFVPARWVNIEGVGTLSFDTTVTLSVGSEVAYASPTLPTFVGVGAKASGTGAVTPDLPTGIQTNDILLLFAESNRLQAVTIPNPNGGTWTEVTGSPQSSTASRLTVFWSRYNGTQGNPTTNDPGNHICAAIAAWRGVVTTENPWDVTSSGIDNVSNTSVSIPGATTATADCLVIAIVGHGRANNNPSVSGWANTSLSDLVERVDYCTNSGGGGGFGVAEGGKATAGAYNPTTATLAAASTKGLMTIALKPALGVDISNTPSSKAFGIVAANTTYWSNGSAPTFPLDDAECYFTVTNNGGTCSITIKATNFTGGVGWALGTPAENVTRLKAGKSGDANEDAMVTLTTSDQAFISALANLATKKWEIKMETPTSFTDGVVKTSTVTLTATLD